MREAVRAEIVERRVKLRRSGKAGGERQREKDQRVEQPQSHPQIVRRVRNAHKWHFWFARRLAGWKRARVPRVALKPATLTRVRSLPMDGKCRNATTSPRGDEGNAD